ncbi:MAG: hypothetical protein SO435_06575 [Peptostreptococcus porci]|nr:hypothetical protein [Peptostreptococcus porci]
MGLYTTEVENLQNEINYLKNIVKLQDFKITTLKNRNTELERINKELEYDNIQLNGILGELEIEENPF